METPSPNLSNSNRLRNFSQTLNLRKKAKLVKKLKFNEFLNNEKSDNNSPLNFFSSLDNINEKNGIKQMILSKNKPIFLSEVNSTKNTSSFGSRKIRHLTTNFSEINLKSYMKKNENLLKTFFKKTKSLENTMKQKEYEYDDLNKFKFSSQKALDDLYFNKNDLRNIIEKESIANIKLQESKKKYYYISNKLEKSTKTLKIKNHYNLKNLKTYSKNKKNFKIINKETQNLFDTLKYFKKDACLLSPDNAKIIDEVKFKEDILEIQKSIQDDNDKNGKKYKEKRENFFRKNEFYKHFMQLNNDIAYKYRFFFADKLGFNKNKSYANKIKDKYLYKKI